MSDFPTDDMRTDDFPLDLVSLQLDDYDVVQQQANEQLKNQVGSFSFALIAGKVLKSQKHAVPLNGFFLIAFLCLHFCLSSKYQNIRLYSYPYLIDPISCHP